VAIRLSRGALMDAATALLVLVAAGFVVNDRVVPALAERARIDPGDRVEGLRLRGLASGDTVELTGDAPSLVVVFRSTCPACEATAPDWAALGRIAPGRLLAVGLEAEQVVEEWVRRELAGVEPMIPIDPARFVDRLRIRAVPTTLLFDRGRLALARVGPLQPEDRTRIRRAFETARTAQTVRAR